MIDRDVGSSTDSATKPVGSCAGAHSPISHADFRPAPDPDSRPVSSSAPGLGVDDTIEQLTALRRDTLNVFVERRRQRPDGAPTRIQEHVLLAIRDRGRLQVSEVASLLGIAPATTSQLLTAMEEKGWLQRSILPQDRRRHQVTLTSAGQEVVQQLESRRRERFARLLAELSAEERAQLVTLAHRVVELIARMPQDPDGEGI